MTTVVADALLTEPRRTRGWPFRANPPAVPAEPEPEAQADMALQRSELRRRMIWDVVMVLAWGALIPGLMWLGAAAGF
ncbi:hypothetical protein [Bordetella avium]|uniref:Uncharacterized protein n=1 Tax=Bordetella avium (strain 197N) TaxID=360910 RepID=Q2L2Q4_BORA1|nr:hypothetical protein [Bordetella avium]RIQ54538.1 hypothetical protein D0843_03020 [Bordetella avium]RIQ70965.1 hypothetical protein D0838_09525 [Bordetella avium]CAJ48980.1 hypothetical protein BAV1371 [Bordetella avium 197N]